MMHDVMHASVWQWHTVTVHSQYLFAWMNQLSEDVKASCVSYGHTLVILSRVEFCCSMTISQDKHLEWSSR